MCIRDRPAAPAVPAAATSGTRHGAGTATAYGLLCAVLRYRMVHCASGTEPAHGAMRRAVLRGHTCYDAYPLLSSVFTLSVLSYPVLLVLRSRVLLRFRGAENGYGAGGGGGWVVWSEHVGRRLGRGLGPLC
eukprot:856915-Rhodomonas_salina.1